MTMQAARPLRAVAVILTMYVGGRLAALGAVPVGLETDAIGPLTARPALASVERMVAGALHQVARVAVPSAEAKAAYVSVRPALPRHVPAAPPQEIARPRPPAASAHAVTAAVALARTAEITPAVASGASTAPPPPTLLPDPAVAAIPVHRGRRLSGAFWLLARDDSAGALLAPGGTLGGSQTGARLFWQPTRLPAFLTVRASAALATRDREIAPGVGMRGRNVGVILEQRFSLEHGRASETALLAYGGVSEVKAPLGFRLDGYAQVGVVGVSRRALFIDGAARAERPVLGSGRTRLGAGAGVWGAAQPGASRVDIGPQLVLHVATGGIGARVSAEYRLRVAGDAKPSSGPALTVGADF